jgi:hypothetical protein
MGRRSLFAATSVWLALIGAVTLAATALTGTDGTLPLGRSTDMIQPLDVFSILALALAMILRHWHRLALGLAVVTGLATALAFAEYVFATSFGTARIAGTLVASDAPEPVGLAPITAAALALASAAVALIAAPGPTQGRRAIWAQAVAGVAGLLILYGFLDGLTEPPPDALHPMSQVAPHSAVLLLLLALAIQLRCATIPADARLPLLDRAAAWALALLCGGVILFWQLLERAEWQNRWVDTGIALAMVSENLTTELERRGHALQRLARRWDTYGAPTQIQWERDAAALQETFPNLHAIHDRA